MSLDRGRTVFSAAVLFTAAAVAACGEEEVADVPYDSMKPAVASGDMNAFEPFKGTRVRWSGTLTEAVVRRGDDYIEEGHLYVDLDGDSGGDTAPDLTMAVSPDQARSLAVGSRVTFVAVVREIARGEAKPMIRAEMVEIAAP